MKIVLSVKNKMRFIDGSIPKPLESDRNLTNAWIRNDNIVISWLLNSVSKDISAIILFAESATEIWNDLSDQFQQCSGPRIFQLRRDLLSLRQDHDSVSVYFIKIKALWEELNKFRPMCSCGQCTCNGVKSIHAFVQMDYTMTFLIGLNDSFAQVRSQVLLLEPIPPINRVFALVIQEERQRAIGPPSTSALITMVWPLYLGEQSQLPTPSRLSQRFQRGRPYCTSCHVPGHTIETCYKIHGYPPDSKHRPKYVPRNTPATVNQTSGISSSLEGTVPSVPPMFDKLHKVTCLTM